MSVVDVTVPQPEKKYLEVTRMEWLKAVVYLLMMALYGLDFYPAILVIACLLLNSYNKDKYSFLIQATLFFGCYALTDPDRNFPIKPEDIALAISIIGAVIYKKTKLVKNITILIFVYCAVVFLIAMTSEELLSIQIRRMRTYFSILYFFVPLLVFANQRFEIDRFFRTVLIYSILLSLFYAIDGFILNGYVLIPNSFVWSNHLSKFYDLIWSPLSFDFTRKYPQGLYLLVLAVYPVCRYYKLKKWQIFIVFMGLMSCRTMTFIFGLAVAYILVIGKIRLLFRYAGYALVALVLLYFVDRSVGGFMRISSTVDQFREFAMPEEQFDGQQDETEVSFGSGRLAQALPKLELMYSLNRMWLGLGFLHPTETTNQKFIIINPFYLDISSAEEVATGVEITQVQTLLDIGFLGLILQTIFFIALYMVVMKYKYSMYFLSSLICFFIAGLGGFGGYITPQSLYLISISLAVIVLVMKHGDDTEQRSLSISEQ